MLRLLQFWFAHLSRFMPRFSGRLLAQLFLTPSRYPIQSDTGRRLLERAERRELASVNGKAIVWRWHNTGPRVLVLHGWSDRAANLGDVIQRLLDEGYDVTAADMPAHGESGGMRTNMREWQLMLRAMPPEDGVWNAIVAHSLGAFVAGALTRDDLPQYGPVLRAERLVLIAPPNASMDMLHIFGDVLHVPARVREEAVRVLSDIIHADFADFSTASALAAYTGVAMVVHDRDDQRVPFSHFEAIRQRAPAHRYLETQGLGHRRLLSDAATLDEIMEFLHVESRATRRNASSRFA